MTKITTLKQFADACREIQVQAGYENCSIMCDARLNYYRHTQKWEPAYQCSAFTDDNKIVQIQESSPEKVLAILRAKLMPSAPLMDMEILQASTPNPHGDDEFAVPEHLKVNA